MHEFTPNKKGLCTHPIGLETCYRPETALPHQRWKEKEQKEKRGEANLIIWAPTTNRHLLAAALEALKIVASRHDLSIEGDWTVVEK